MKVATVFGTRPEIIRLSRVIERLDGLCDQKLIHTGQNYDPNLSDIFFEELNVRQPDECWGIRAGSFSDQIAEIIRKAGECFAADRPDRVLILGDTNSGLVAMVAARMGIPVYHMEAGNRCFDDRVPEEINRRIIDHCSEILMPYTHRSKENLLREGVDRTRIYVTGNPIWEVIQANKTKIDASDVLARLGLKEKRYVVVTVHRSENVDDVDRLSNILAGLDAVAEEFQYPVIVSLHPRTADKISKNGLSAKSTLVRYLTPVGFFDFVRLEQTALCILTDSGTVQEESTLLKTPSVILRDVTERGECLEAGSGILSGANPEDILRATKVVIKGGCDWVTPVEYLQENVSQVVSSIVLGRR